MFGCVPSLSAHAAALLFSHGSDEIFTMIFQDVPYIICTWILSVSKRRPYRLFSVKSRWHVSRSHIIHKPTIKTKRHLSSAKKSGTFYHSSPSSLTSPHTSWCHQVFFSQTTTKQTTGDATILRHRYHPC